MELGVAKARQSSWHRLLPARSCGWGKAGLTQNECKDGDAGSSRGGLEKGVGFPRSRDELTDPDLIKQCIDECTARIEIGLHYQIPYPRPIHLPPMGLTPLRGRRLQTQEKLRKLSKPVYLQSHDEIS
ncbi:LYR motif-containing protein 1 isoform X1 [Arvicola amphibius]|uniref:LYR motif-containing protein 1 isoform X1 n=1 Tax=Arvicola amphibius TaxID=1047088 RepID=UPI0018E305CF|nr:LYR motif-containing protein 1 isoform X1 [Arvicola amphibius]